MTEHEHSPLDALAGLPPAEPPPMSRLLEADLAKLAPISLRRPRRQLAIVIGISLACAVLALGVLSLRRDLSELPVMWIGCVAAAWLATFVLLASIVLVPPLGEMMPRAYLARRVAIVAGLGFVALGLLVHPSGPSSVHYGWLRFLRGHFCLELGLAIASVPIIAGAICLRRTLPLHSRWIAAALGAGAGCVGGFVLHLYCKIADGPHIGVIHGGVVTAAALLSAALVPRVIDR